MDPRQAYAWSEAVLRALRAALHDLAFTEILPAILSSRFEPGARHGVAVLGDRARPTVTLDGPGEDPNARVRVDGARHAYLPVSHVVENQFALEHVPRVCCMTPCVRLLMDGERRSGLHLYTYFQLGIEWRTEDVDDVLATVEALLGRFADALRGAVPAEAANRPDVTTRLASLGAIPYPRIPFRDAVGRVRASPHVGAPNPHSPVDLTLDEARRLSEGFDVPFWVDDYPEGARDALYRRNASGAYDSFDLFLPHGHGELATGGLRPESAEEIERQSRLLAREHHPGYAEWKRRTGIQSGGIGIGLERLGRYCSAAASVLDLRRPHDSGPNDSIEREPAGDPAARP